ncbi:MAG: hypothetical protein M3340_03780 [Actinomycetota bacterium]|nr:hypothetical protein [Actinomycetota bacterium]
MRSATEQNAPSRAAGRTEGLDREDVELHLVAVADEIEATRRRLDELGARRNELVLAATRDGLSRRVVATLARLTPARVQQIVARGRSDEALNAEAVRVDAPALPSAPAADASQYLHALHHANRVRLARAELKRNVASKQLRAADVIRDCPWEAASMELSDLLMSQRRWGRARVRRTLLSLGLPENKQIGTLTFRQREALAKVLSDKEGSSDRPAEPLPGASGA